MTNEKTALQLIIAMKKILLLFSICALTQLSAQTEINTSGSWCDGSFQIELESTTSVDEIRWFKNDQLLTDEVGLSLNCTKYGNGAYHAVYKQDGEEFKLVKEISEQTPVAKIEAMNVLAAAVVVFKDVSESTEEIVAWHWDFGNGETSTEQNPKVMYKEETTYTVTLRVTTATGCVNETQVQHKWAYE